MGFGEAAAHLRHALAAEEGRQLAERAWLGLGLGLGLAFVERVQGAARPLEPQP